MQTAHAWVEINELHDNVQLKHITPAEALVIRKQFGIKVAGQAKPTSPITHLDISLAGVERTKEQEFTRLCKKYGNKYIEGVFPGENPNIPLTFKEAGFEATKESAPQVGEAQVVVALEKLSKEEVTDKESVKEVEARLAQAKMIEAQNAKIAELTALVEKLVKPEVAPKPEKTAAEVIAEATKK